jgi:hypothetical protein
MDMEGSGHSFTEVYPDISVQELRENMKNLEPQSGYQMPGWDQKYGGPRHL